MDTPMIVDEEKCIGCGMCVADCPKDALRVTSSLKAEISDQCVGCGICSLTCPRQAITANPAPGEDYLTCGCCPVHCRIKAGQTGACKRFRHIDHELKREIPLHVIDKSKIILDPQSGLPDKPLLTGIGAGTNLQKVPARIIAGEKLGGVEVVTAVTEAVLSFSGLRVKIDTSDYIGAEGSAVKREGKVVGYLTSSWYGSRTMTVGGVTLLKGPHGFTAARTMIDLVEGRTVTLSVEGGAQLELTAGRAPVINGREAPYTTFGCGSSVGKLFSKKLLPLVDECIMLDMGITGQLSEHHAALGAKPCGITVIGKKSSAGRYLVPSGRGWGGTCVEDPLDAIAGIDKNKAWPGLRILITETKAQNAAYFELDENLEPAPREMPPQLREVCRHMKDYCDPGKVNILYTGGVGGGVMGALHPEDSPAVASAIRAGKIRITAGGRPVHLMPGGNLIIEVDTAGFPKGSFSWVPTPATTMPLEFSMTKEVFLKVCGYPGALQPLEQVLAQHEHIYLK